MKFKIVGTFKKRKNVDKYAYRVSLKEIRGNEFNLNIPRYVDTFEEEEEMDVAEVQKEIEALEGELAEIREEMAGYLKEFGFRKQIDRIRLCPYSKCI